MSETFSKALPLGSADFPVMRGFADEIYVDKTDLIYRLARLRAKIFLARPRRFGKSLLVSTFESLFRHGLRDFQGLAMESLWKEERTYRVLRLDFSLVKDFSSVEGFLECLNAHLKECSGVAGVEMDDSIRDPIDRFSAFLSKQPPVSLVLLIDEYDAPLTTHLLDVELISGVQNKLSRFYASIKRWESRLRFFFFTGITKLSHTSIFSELNNVMDISLNPEFGRLLGYTEDEIRTYFGEYVEKAGQTLGLSFEEVMRRMTERYDGYCFDSLAKSRLFAPWSVLNFLTWPLNGFRNYWYESGGRPSLLVDFAKANRISGPATYGTPFSVSYDTLVNAADLRTPEDINPVVMLMQCGYLTIKDVRGDGREVVLGYPNQEVAESMAQLYADLLLPNGRRRLQDEEPPISLTLREGTVDDVVRYLNLAFNSMDYLRFPATNESMCRALVQALLIGGAMLPVAEVHSSHGRSDLEVDAGHRRWIFEFKFAQKEKESRGLLEKALEQIQRGHYGEGPHGKELHRVGLFFSRDKRRFTVWKDLKEESSSAP